MEDACSRELNGVAQLVTWFVINKKLFHPKKHTNWHDVLYGISESLSGDMTQETARLITILSLLMKVYADDDTVHKSAKSIVILLERIAVFPELAEFHDDLCGFLDEAKCQVVLQYCTGAGSDNKETLDVWSKYFNHSDTRHSKLGQTLHQLLCRHKSKSFTADMDRFKAEHSVSQFKLGLVEIINSALNRFKTYHLYSSIQDQMVSQLVFDTPLVEVASSHELEHGQEVEQDGDEEKDEGEREEGVSEEEGGNREEEENDRDGAEEGEAKEGREKGEPEVMDGRDDDESSEEVIISNKRKRPRVYQEGEEVEWDSSESVEVITPPSHLPGNKRVTVRSRDSLIGTTPPTRRGGRGAWTTIETEQLLKGVKELGVGNWSAILAHFKFTPQRTATSLKDKWRNLQGRLGHTK